MDKKQRKINDFSADPSTNEVVAYNVAVLDPQNSDYSEIQAGTIVDPSHKHPECATTDQKQNGHDDHVTAGSADPLTIMYLHMTFQRSQHVEVDILVVLGYYNKC